MESYDFGMVSRLTCSCGRVFSQLNALSNHKRSCAKTKKRLFSALSAAKEAHQQRKRQRLLSIDPSTTASTTVIKPGLIAETLALPAPQLECEVESMVCTNPSPYSRHKN